MNLEFKGKYKSLTDFTWNNVPRFVVITGPNGSGKTQLLELIYDTIVRKDQTQLRIMSDGLFAKDVAFLKGEWELNNTSYVSLADLQKTVETHYQLFLRHTTGVPDKKNVKAYAVYRGIAIEFDNNIAKVSREEFYNRFPELFFEKENELGQILGVIFYNYRLAEIELQAKQKTTDEIKEQIGEKPWIVLREILKEAKLPFDVNDPSALGFRDVFQLKFIHQVSNEEVQLKDLSSGERVLISLMFYLYNSQEKKVFPKLLLLDEPDAHLHPSMSQQFLNVVKNVLVDKFGVQVIMTTHSPSTVMLSPEDAIYEMSRHEPRIQKSPSKNHAVSLLTAGLVYVGEGTRYFLVEDKDDVTFYTYVYSQLTIDGIMDGEIPLVFIPASTNDKTGGKSVISSWVKKLRESGLVGVLQGLIDEDSGNVVGEGLYKINRYSIENYLADPLLVYAVLMDREKLPEIPGVQLSVGEEYKLKQLPAETLQQIADKIFDMVTSHLPVVFADFNSTTDMEKVEIAYSNGVRLLYPRWLLKRRGKDILQQVYEKAFTSPVVNFSTLFKALRKLNLFPLDLVQKLQELKNGSSGAS